MKFLTNLCILIFSLSIITSCNKEEYLNGEYDCTFEEIDDNRDGEYDDTEIAIVDECRDNAFTSKVEIENNLIGEWQLVGYIAGWIPTHSQPCSRIIISEEELILEYTDAYTDAVTTYSWEIRETNAAGNQQFSLITTPYSTTAAMGLFCDNYMYSSVAAPDDADLYIYQKVE